MWIIVLIALNSLINFDDFFLPLIYEEKIYSFDPLQIVDDNLDTTLKCICQNTKYESGKQSYEIIIVNNA